MYLSLPVKYRLCLPTSFLIRIHLICSLCPCINIYWLTYKSLTANYLALLKIYVLRLSKIHWPSNTICYIQRNLCYDSTMIFMSVPLGKSPCLQSYIVTLNVITKLKAEQNAEMINLISFPRGQKHFSDNSALTHLYSNLFNSAVTISPQFTHCKHLKCCL